LSLNISARVVSLAAMDLLDFLCDDLEDLDLSVLDLPEITAEKQAEAWSRLVNVLSAEGYVPPGGE
jgi:hypothetical protein